MEAAGLGRVAASLNASQPCRTVALYVSRAITVANDSVQIDWIAGFATHENLFNPRDSVT